MSFGLIDYKKDPTEILHLVSDDINKGMKELVDGKLMGFKDQYNNTRLVILPRGSKNIQATTPTTIKYTLSNEVYTIHLTLGFQPSSEYTIWTIIGCPLILKQNKSQC